MTQWLRQDLTRQLDPMRPLRHLRPWDPTRPLLRMHLSDLMIQ
jgi:hypothetical protein